MNYTPNYNLNKPERNEQFNLDHWNENTEAIDTAMNTNKVNIATNKSSIDTILTGLSTKNVSDTSSVYYKLMKLIYPVGSIYWSSNSTNPATLFGGTWVQIKDKFVLACGNTYKTAGAIGGNANITLTEAQMPSHSHSFTPKGTISGHQHNISAYEGSFSTSTDGSHTHEYYWDKTSGSSDCPWVQSALHGYSHYTEGSTSTNGSHTHSVSVSFPKKLTDSVITTFKGTAGTTGNTGSGASINILPPYIVKYCWERTK